MTMRYFRLILLLVCLVLVLHHARAEPAPAVAPDAPPVSPELDLRPVHTIADAHPKGVAALAIFDESQLLMSTGHSREAKVWDLKTGKLVRELPMHTAGRALAFSPSGKLVAAGGGEFDQGKYRGGITIWKTADWKELRSISVQAADVNALAFLSEETLISGGHSGLRVWDVATGEQRQFIELPAAVLAMDLSPDRSLLGFGTFTACCYFLTTKDWAIVHTTQAQRGEPRSAAFSSDGALFSSGDAGRQFTVWDVKSRERLHVISGSTFWACSQFKGDTAIAVGGNHQKPGVIAICDLRKGAILRVIQAHADQINALALNPGRTVAATGAGDGSLIIWEVGAK